MASQEPNGGLCHRPELAVRTLLRSYRYHGTPGQAKDLVPVACNLTTERQGGTVCISQWYHRHPDRSSELRTNNRTTLGMLYQGHRNGRALASTRLASYYTRPLPSRDCMNAYPNVDL